MSGSSGDIAFLYSVGTSFMPSIPDEAMLTPAIPPKMMRKAGMFRSPPRGVPSMTAPARIPPMPTAIPMGVDAFIHLCHRPPPGVLKLTQSFVHRAEHAIGLEGLHDEVLGPDLDRLEHLGLLSEGGAHDHAGTRIEGHDLLQRGQAVLLGHGDVQRGDLGAQLLVLRDGLVAVAQYQELRPEVTTLDITMPEKDGLTALQEIMTLDPGARVIMCSALGQESKVLESIKIGAKDFVVKPFQPDRVLGAVDKALS